MTIRRLAAADCQELSTFLARNFRDDVLSGGRDAPTKDFLQAQLSKAESWVAVEGGVIVGVLGPVMHGEQEINGQLSAIFLEKFSLVVKVGTIRTFSYYDRLVVDFSIYKTSKADALRIAKELGLGRQQEAETTGTLSDDFVSEGLTKSRGASFCRLLGMAEEVRGEESKFIMPCSLVKSRLAALP